MKPRKPDESDAAYIARLESANRELRKHNEYLTKWAKDINHAVTVLSCDGSLVFQAMAEKARVRSHPSVTKAVEMFDSISHPQWMKEAKRFPVSEWPTEWDFDPPDAQSGDADMQLNAPIAAAIDYLEGKKFSTSAKEWEHVCEIINGLHEATQRHVEGVKEAVGFVPRTIQSNTKRPEDMEKDELVALIRDMSWMALDLAQDMECANVMLRRDLRASAYRRIGGCLYRLAYADWERPEPSNFDIKVLGEERPF